MHRRDGKAAVAATQAYCHDIFLWEAEIAVNFAHHIVKDFICGIASMHAAAKFSGGKVAYFIPLVIEFWIVGF